MAGPTSSFVDDLAEGCQVLDGLDTCPNLVGDDPVLNFMNYIRDENCYYDSSGSDVVGEFTCGQIERMYHQWIMYRDSVERCAQGEMEIEWLIQYDYFFASENSFTLTNTETGEVLFNSERDLYDVGVAADLHKTQYVDLCVPIGSYEFRITDKPEEGAGDGFTPEEDAAAYAEALGVDFIVPFIDLYLNGAFVERIEGNFGSVKTVALVGTGNANPSPSTGNSFPTPSGLNTAPSPSTGDSSNPNNGDQPSQFQSSSASAARLFMSFASALSLLFFSVPVDFMS
jgi:hypothetical protein